MRGCDRLGSERIVGNSYPIRSAPAFLFADVCNRSLGAPLAYFECSTHLRPREPVTAQLGNSGGINVYSWSSELLTLRPCIAKTSPNALLNERPLELGHRSDNLEHQPARSVCGRRCPRRKRKAGSCGRWRRSYFRESGASSACRTLGDRKRPSALRLVT